MAVDHSQPSLNAIESAVVINAARRLRARWIVIGSHGRSGLPLAVLGSVAESVMHRSDIPVVVVPLRHPAAHL